MRPQDPTIAIPAAASASTAAAAAITAAAAAASAAAAAAAAAVTAAAAAATATVLLLLLLLVRLLRLRLLPLLLLLPPPPLLCCCRCCYRGCCFFFGFHCFCCGEIRDKKIVERSDINARVPVHGRVPCKMTVRLRVLCGNGARVARFVSGRRSRKRQNDTADPSANTAPVMLLTDPRQPLSVAYGRYCRRRTRRATGFKWLSKVTCRARL